MIGAVNQHAGDTGRSHLANRYFVRALHRGWLLDETEAARRASNLEGAPGRPKLPGGRQSISALTTTQWMVSALDRNRVMPPHSIRFDHIVFKRYAFGVIFLEPSARSFFVHKNFELAGIANTVSGVDIDPNGRHWSSLACAGPNACLCDQDLNVRSTWRFKPRNTPMHE
jgi:hypothetical protein